jgi:hypothetical protein
VDGLLAGHTIAAAMATGPGAASAWARLMEANDPVGAVKACGKWARGGDGRRYCRVPLWLDPPTTPQENAR